MAAGPVSSNARVYVDFLKTFGVAEPELTKLKDTLFEANQLHIDGFGRVELSNLTRFAKQLNIPIPETQLATALGRSAELAHKLSTETGDFRTLSASPGETRSHEERSGPAKLATKALGSLSSPLQAFLDGLHESKRTPERIELGKDGIDSAELIKLLDAHGGAARQRMTLSQIEAAKTIAFSATGPAYTERDAVLGLDSTFRSLSSEKKGDAEINVYKKSGFDNFFLRRHEDGASFSIHAFRAQNIVVTLPKGAQAVLVDADGHQRGLRLPTKRQDINGAATDVIEISPEHVRSSNAVPAKLDFTLRVIDKNGEPLFERHLAFDAEVGQRSERLFGGTFAYPEKPTFAGGELSDEHFARFVPSPTKNPVPAGRRPKFELDGLGTFDRLLLTKDGKNFPIADWVQFGTPPKAQQQALKAEGGARLLLSHRGSSESHLDHPNYKPTAGFTLRDSFGHAATFDRELSQTNQASWDHRGLRVTAGSKVYAVDPLTPG